MRARQSRALCPTLITFAAPIRNIVFVLLFLFLDLNFWLLVGACELWIELWMPGARRNGALNQSRCADLNIGHGTSLLSVPHLLKAAGAFAFLTTMMGELLEPSVTSGVETLSSLSALSQAGGSSPRRCLESPAFLFACPLEISVVCFLSGLGLDETSRRERSGRGHVHLSKHNSRRCPFRPSSSVFYPSYASLGCLPDLKKGCITTKRRDTCQSTMRTASENIGARRLPSPGPCGC